MENKISAKAIIVAGNLQGKKDRNEIETIISLALRDLKNDGVKVIEQDAFLDGVGYHFARIKTTASQVSKETIDNSQIVQEIINKYKK